MAGGPGFPLNAWCLLFYTMETLVLMIRDSVVGIGWDFNGKRGPFVLFA